MATNKSTPISAAEAELYYSPWNFGGGASSGGGDVTPDIEDIITTGGGWVQQSGQLGKPAKQIVSRIQNKDGTWTVTYDDGTKETTGTPIDNTKNQSAYDALNLMLTQNGLSSLIDPLKKLFESGITDADSLSLALSQTPEYKTRFSANDTRINQGLRALSPAEYVKMEDSYQNLMRQYGLPASYYAKDSIGKQAGFEQLLANDISSTELEDRLIQAQQKVNQATPEIKQAIKDFYGDSITNGDILAYALDPKNALSDIKRKVATAEIQGAAAAQGLNQINASSTPDYIKSLEANAGALAAAGITKAQAQQGYGTIAGMLPTAQQLSDIYANQGLGAYGQSQAEADIFGTTGGSEAERLRKKLAKLEQAQFGAQSGTAGSGALSRDRALTNYMLGTPGAGAF